jgi:protein TonB
MPRHQHFTIFILISLALHALVITAAVFLIKPPKPETSLPLPVDIINLPQQALRNLPPLQPPAPVRPSPAVPPVPSVPKPIVPERPLLPGEVPMPKKFGDSDDVKLPKTMPRTGIPEGAEQGKETGKPGIKPLEKPGPLPFLTQNDIDELARRGMPAKRPGDESVTLDTDEFKFISYNRWLKLKVESVLRYPELAAVSGYQGAMYVKFDILKDGSLGSVEMLKSSGYKILDDEAMRSIRASAPFQPLPDEWKMDRYSIRAAVIFYLGTGYIR